MKLSLELSLYVKAYAFYNNIILADYRFMVEFNFSVEMCIHDKFYCTSLSSSFQPFALKNS